MRLIFITGTIVFILLNSFCNGQVDVQSNPENILSYEVNPQLQELKFFWKDENDSLYANFDRLQSILAKSETALIFAMNGGMYTANRNPQGLYIENGIILSKIDRQQKGYGNFYLQPNGIFSLTKNNKPQISITDKFRQHENIKYATQSGPMLLIDGAIHPKLNQGSANLHIRNGVGILANGNLLFALSKEKINFYDFASFFKDRGCQQALYLDGFVSRAYLTAKQWKQTDGKFGVIIAEVKNKN